MLEHFNNRNLFKKLELEVYPEPEIIKLNYPVLLCHGYGAFATLVKPSPLYDIALWIRTHGVWAFAPNIVPYATIETRAEEWKTLIKDLSNTHDISRFNIVAHSMGGLDIRYAITKLDIAPYVDSLTTIATPHRGSSLAELVLKTPDSLQEKLGELFNWVGDRIYPKTKSDTIGSVKQLTPAYLSMEFNPSVPDVEGIPYYSYSAAVGKDTDQPIERYFQFQHQHIYENEGKNDGFVSVESARWGEHIETASLSHFEQINLRTSKTRRPQVRSFWQNILKTLKEKGH